MYLISAIDFEIIKKTSLGFYLVFVCVILAPFVASPLSVYFYLIFSLTDAQDLLAISHSSQIFSQARTNYDQNH